MRALLLKPWGGYQPGQVLTAYAPGSIPADAAVWYGDDETVPMLPVINGAIDPQSPELAGKIGAVLTETPADPEIPPTTSSRAK
jgi:hypothetical protein